MEVINKKGKNTIIGTIYRHPCMDQSIFINDYMQPLNDKLLKENKKIFIGGDFNFDLVKIDNNETFNFFETMMSSHLLPTITLPTKINPKKNSIIDNIFTNQIHPDMKSGNLTLAISDHLHTSHSNFVTFYGVFYGNFAQILCLFMVNWVQILW